MEYHFINYPHEWSITDNMLPIELQTPRDMARTLARRVRALRLDRGWTQEEIAERAGLSLATYRRFERTGRISLERLLKLAVILDARAGFDQLFLRSPARSLAELEERAERQTRRRGRRRDAEA
jgi:transcriptional regulator with XRE-family HTH domain